MLAADAAAEQAERDAILAMLLGLEVPSPGSVDGAESVAPEPSPERMRRRDDES
jgi:hypothetical protein